jgi:hypothetical protein
MTAIKARYVWVMLTFGLALGAAWSEIDFKSLHVPTSGVSTSCGFYSGAGLRIGVRYADLNACTDVMRIQFNGQPVGSSAANSWKIANWQAGRFSLAEGRPQDLGVSLHPTFGQNCATVEVMTPRCVQTVLLYPTNHQYGRLMPNLLWGASLGMAAIGLALGAFVVIRKRFFG